MQIAVEYKQCNANKMAFMQLISFSVSNYRSITAAQEIPIANSTILIGKNNEGKSNILKALNIAMNILKYQRRGGRSPYYMRTPAHETHVIYRWDRDFPISLQSRKQGLESIFKLDFELTPAECAEFRAATGSSCNGHLPVVIAIGKEEAFNIKIPKPGKNTKSGLNSKTEKIAAFIGQRITFNYIPAVRTKDEAMEVVDAMLAKRIMVLEDDAKYQKALAVVQEMQQEILNEVATDIKNPLQEFLPNIVDVKIDASDMRIRRNLRRDFDIIVDDGALTSLENKGDGVQSLATLGLLKHRTKTQGASIIAIEEPESHLHPEAIHQLNRVIKGLSDQHQIIVTTHNPLFVDRHKISSNIIVDAGKAKAARRIRDVREVLGVQVADNLSSANYILVVEGEEDALALNALLPVLSEKIAQSIKANTFVIEPMYGTGNILSKISMLRSYMCAYHVLLDHDDAGKNAYNRAEAKKYISAKNTSFTTCQGKQNSEFEDMIDTALYSDAIQSEYGVNINTTTFRGNDQWSDRMAKTFQSQGKLWDNNQKAKVKYTVAQCIASNPSAALNTHHRGAIDALTVALEQMLL